MSDTTKRGVWGFTPEQERLVAKIIEGWLTVVKKRDARIAELEAIIERMISDADSAKNAYAELEEQYTELEAQLAQTQEPTL